MDANRSTNRGEFRIKLVEAEHETELGFPDPIVTGRQVLEVAKRFPADEYMLLVLQKNGMLEEINLDESVDLRPKGEERFFVFRNDHVQYFDIDGRRFPWGEDEIKETMLKSLAGVPDEYRVWLERKGEEDLEIGVGSLVDLRKRGVERFYTGVPSTTAGLGFRFLPQSDQRYLADHGIVAEEVEQNDQKGVVVKGFPVPRDLFAAEQADVLILLPNAYPDSPPDMFYTTPWLCLSNSNQPPKAADVKFNFIGHEWQRWSRHNRLWRPGVDGIWTMLHRIEHALRSAE